MHTYVRLLRPWGGIAHVAPGRSRTAVRAQHSAPAIVESQSPFSCRTQIPASDGVPESLEAPAPSVTTPPSRALLVQAKVGTTMPAPTSTLMIRNIPTMEVVRGIDGSRFVWGYAKHSHTIEQTPTGNIRLSELRSLADIPRPITG